MAAGVHSLRIDEDLWNAAKLKATLDGTSLSSIIRQRLRLYTNDIGESELATNIVAAFHQYTDDQIEELGKGDYLQGLARLAAKTTIIQE